MLEIIWDKSLDDTFLNEKRPVFTLENISAQNWSDYIALAQKIISAYRDIPIIIIHPENSSVSLNWLAVALFVQSCLTENKVDAVVFKVAEYEKALAAYKPFVALTIGIKYVIRLYQEELDNVYNEISGLSYLGLNIKEDFVKNKLLFSLPGEGRTQNFSTQTIAEALTVIGIMKSLVLSPLSISIKAEIYMDDKQKPTEINSVIDKIAEYFWPLFN